MEPEVSITKIVSRDIRERGASSPCGGITISSA